jgi:diguanylate cyclase (GGDEF)-like protein
MELRLYFQMLRRGWWIIVLTTLAALIAALVASFLARPQYTASARFILTPSTISTTGPDVIFQGLNTIDNATVTTTYAEVMSSSRIFNDAVSFMKLTGDDLKAYTYKAQVLPNSSLIELTVTGPDAAMAAKFANAIGFQTIELTRRLNPVINIDFLDQAVPAVVPSSPQPLRDASLAVVLGLIVGAVLAISSEQLRTSLESFRQELHMDTLTGVYSSKYFPRLLEDQLAKNSRDPLSVGIVELTGLADLVGTYPEAAVQKVLKVAVDALRRELRGGDVIGRWNDNSFSVMLPNTTGSSANGIFERILQALSAPVDLDQFGTRVSLDAHIGGAEYGQNMSAQDLFNEAMAALEQTRREKVTRVYVSKPKNSLLAQKKVAES